MSEAKTEPIDAWFNEAKFGMFLHWGIYALLGRGEQVLFREHLVPSEYFKLADQFTAPKFDAHEWAAIARDAGMNYMVLTSKHHDGFCLFESEVSDFTSTATAAKRDFIAEYVEGCRQAGLRVGIYYSLADWHWPVYFEGPEGHEDEFAEFIDYTHAQVRELCTNYGPIDFLWFDGQWPYSAAQWRAVELDDIIRSLQPQVLINDRLHGEKLTSLHPPDEYADHIEGYVDSSERTISATGTGRPWEVCEVMHRRWWGYSAGDRHWKSVPELMTIMAQAAGAGANFLLNVGPRGDGSFPEPAQQGLAALGEWTRQNGEAFYGSQGASRLFEFLTTGCMTQKGDTLYLWVLRWHGETLHFCGLKNDIHSARVLGRDDIEVSIRRDGENIYLDGLPQEPPNELCTVIALELDSEPEGLEWAKHPLWGDNAKTYADWART